MNVVVERGRDEPAYEQIAGQIRMMIFSGRLAPGAILPSVRTLASDLGFNLNTVARAYRLLEQEGFVCIRSRVGVEVLPPADGSDSSVRQRLKGELKTVIARMRQAGVTSAEIEGMVRRELS